MGEVVFTNIKPQRRNEYQGATTGIQIVHTLLIPKSQQDDTHLHEIIDVYSRQITKWIELNIGKTSPDVYCNVFEELPNGDWLQNWYVNFDANGEWQDPYCSNDKCLHHDKEHYKSQDCKSL